MRTLAFITWTSYTHRDFLRYDIINLKKKFRIFFIDISEIIFPEFKKKDKRSFSKQKYYNVFYFKAKTDKEFINILKNNRIDFCIDRFSGNINFRILKIIKDHNIKTVNIFGASKLLKEQIFPLNLKFYLGKIIDFFKVKNTNYDYCFLSGTMAIQQKNISYKNEIYSHSFDYDISKRKNKGKVYLPKKYAVFLDENIVNHPDLQKKTNLYLRLNKEKYYRDLEKFLVFFEKNFEMEVVIAAHPTTTPKILKKLNRFKNYFYSTSDVIKKSSFVLLHTSTAINYSIIFKKKMIFLDHKIFYGNYLGQTIKVNSNFFNTRPLNFSEKFNYDECYDSIIYPGKKYKKYSDYFILHPKKKDKKSISEQLDINLKI